MSERGSTVGVIFGIIIVAGLFTLLGIDMHKDLTVIDTRVETVDGHTYDCTDAYSSDGMTHIGKPQYIQIPTRNIKLIKRIP